MLLLVSTKRSAASGDERPGNGQTIKSKKSSRKSLLASHSMMKMCRSCFITTKYKCLRCELPTCNKCSAFNKMRTLRDRQPVKALHTVRFLTGTLSFSTMVTRASTNKRVNEQNNCAVRFESWYISLLSSAKQQCKMTKFYVFWRA